MWQYLTNTPQAQRQKPPGTKPFPTGTYMRETVKWKRCRSPLKVMKDCGGKLRVVISQYGRSYSPGGHSHLKPPISRFTQVPPFLHTPGAQRPERAFTSQYSPARGQADVRGGDSSNLWHSDTQVFLLKDKLLPHFCRSPLRKLRFEAVTAGVKDAAASFKSEFSWGWGILFAEQSPCKYPTTLALVFRFLGRFQTKW